MIRTPASPFFCANGGLRGIAGGLQIATPVGWTAPTIRCDRASPIQLRPRFGEVDPVGVEVDRNGDTVDLTALGAPWGSSGSEGFTTPPHKQAPTSITARRATQPGTKGGGRPSSGGICRFSRVDFEPGAPPPSSIERQCIGEYHPNLHDCGVEDCPFTEISPESRLRAAREGVLVEGNLSPGDHPKVDHRAFPTPVYVNAGLDVLGHDSSLWVGVQHFSGEVQHRYYHEVHGCPMFTVNFGGCIGVRELRVCDTSMGQAPDPLSMGGTQRTLDFDSQSVASPNNAAAPQLDHLTTSDSDPNDGEWEGAFEDFEDHNSSGMSSPASVGSQVEDPLLDLGFYDANEDTSSWPFAKLWAGDQWMEPNLTFGTVRGAFRGPLPGPTGPRRGVPAQPMEYFMKYWPVEVLEKIVVETNR